MAELLATYRYRYSYDSYDSYYYDDSYSYYLLPATDYLLTR